jgi:hypothetical protein
VDDIEVHGGHRCAVQHCCGATHDDELDAGLGEGDDQRFEVSLARVSQSDTYPERPQRCDRRGAARAATGSSPVEQRLIDIMDCLANEAVNLPLINPDLLWNDRPASHEPSISEPRRGSSGVISSSEPDSRTCAQSRPPRTARLPERGRQNLNRLQV